MPIAAVVIHIEPFESTLAEIAEVVTTITDNVDS
jgi:hypothetical protein